MIGETIFDGFVDFHDTPPGLGIEKRKVNSRYVKSVNRKYVKKLMCWNGACGREDLDSTIQNEI